VTLASGPTAAVPCAWCPVDGARIPCSARIAARTCSCASCPSVSRYRPSGKAVALAAHEGVPLDLPRSRRQLDPHIASGLLGLDRAQLDREVGDVISKPLQMSRRRLRPPAELAQQVRRDRAALLTSRIHRCRGSQRPEMNCKPKTCERCHEEYKPTGAASGSAPPADPGRVRPRRPRPPSSTSRRGGRGSQPRRPGGRAQAAARRLQRTLDRFEQLLRRTSATSPPPSSASA
jgi:hypothetical protein